MTEAEIFQFINGYAQVAKNAISAGFDGVEIHAANGYLIPQFIEAGSNTRTDFWGGSIKKRNRFGIAVTKAVVEAVGGERVGIRLSPYSTFQGMCLTDPLPQYGAFIEELKGFGLAYLSLIESRVSGIIDVEGNGSLEPLLKAWGKTSPVLLAGGFHGGNAVEAVVRARELGVEVGIMFGRLFTSNPDLAFRLQRGIALKAYNREDFYRVVEPRGYIDQAFSEEFLEWRGTAKGSVEAFRQVESV
jgi:NADPH2 dehydrogenase